VEHVTVRPFQERKSSLRGALDLLTGRYPPFLFGGPVGSWLPVFHFHESHPDALEPYFRYLAENGYITVDSDAIAALVLRGLYPGPKSVAICFDDAWASLWIVVAPLLEKYGLRAITYVSPGRVPVLPSPRPQWDGRTPFTDLSVDRSDVPFSTWAELRAMHESGLVDVQAHSWRHAMVSCDSTVTGFFSPGNRRHPHHESLVDAPEGVRLLRSDDTGAPRYCTRSRLSDARRWIAPDAFAACTDLVRRNGGDSFFTRPTWRPELEACAARFSSGRFETDDEREAAILEELVMARELLETGLRAKRIRHMCFPWAIAGQTAVRLARSAGYESAFADRLGGARSVRAGDPPFQLMRLKHRMIFCLPGRGRTWLFGMKTPDASSGLIL
jgi:hypothetical protein